ncbi:Mitochodrial transcription termination factor-related [Macleaya cordata]|uniref:Mitochodrial transcription termination factor-related n=1 Tax=Macleaya cordata TaxID=56857 RepID=A0A200QXB0_MACCD|nr:Mitochodrial transcription termination factor-related [Macleaya cordata]
MAVICFYFFNSRLIHTSFPQSSSSSSNLFRSNFNGEATVKNIRGRKGKRSSTSSFVVLSTHSNPRILKPNLRSRYGQSLSPYDSDDDDDGEVDCEEDDLSSDDDDVVDPEDSDADSKSFHLHKEIKSRQGSRRQVKNGWEERSSFSGQSIKTIDSRLDVKLGKQIPEKRSLEGSFHASDRLEEMGSDATIRGKMKTGKSTGSRFVQLSEELDLDEKWFPLLDYLTTFGLKESHFIQIYERHMPSLQINVASAKERLEFLLSVGVKHRDIKKILLRQPQILGYTVENNLKSHVAFLVDLGVPDSRIGHIITAAPSLFSYSVEQSLKPTARYLVEEVGIKRNDLSKVVQLSPQILVQRIDNTWNTRFCFLSKELGAPRDSIVKMVKKHPQLLHYSIEDGILPRINFLRSIGMRNSEIVKVLTSLTQVLSLSLEDNLKPKYLYLVNELQNEVQSLTKYPTYLSLSLDQRIRPRHRFLVALKKAPKGPFPLSSFVPTDECFCQQWGTSVDKYLAFRQNLLLKEFAKKYQRKG